MIRTAPGPDGLPRCFWCTGDAAYVAYHDDEWGYPVAEDRRLFEKLTLESFQSGLSWRTILGKREGFRTAFAGFDIGRIAAFTDEDVARLLQDPGIVRHRGKIEATVNNARRAQEMIAAEGSLAAFFWRFEAPEGEERIPRVRASSPTSGLLAKELKRRGWKFLGTTTVYALMQAMGLVNDHADSCVHRPRALAARAAFTPPR